MTDETTPKGEPESTPKTFTEDQVKQMLEEHTSGLKSKVDELLGESKAAKAKAREASEKAAKEAEERAKQSGDVEALERSWTEKYDSRESELTSILSEKDSIISRLTAGATAKDVASELALKGSERHVEKMILERLGTEIVEGNPKVIVKDAAGQRSAMTLDDLKKEIRADAGLKPILQGTQGSGAGGVGQNGGAAKEQKVTRESWNTMGHVDRANFIKSGGKVVNG